MKQSSDGDWSGVGAWVSLAKVLWGGASKRRDCSRDLKDEEGQPWGDRGRSTLDKGPEADLSRL